MSYPKSMTNEQYAAMNELRNALNACDHAGLCGGVYERQMFVWPRNADPDPREHDCVFIGIERAGGRMVGSNMILDGGAG